MKRLGEWLRQWFPLLVVAAVFAWSAVAIVSYRAKQAPPGTKVLLRVGHWQLEAGVRDGLSALAAEYSKLRPGVHIVQDPIPEGTYGQWMTTQVMGGTAPDMIEVGMVPWFVLIGFHNRSFLPLTTYVNEPNPYNEGTPFAGMPWRKTYKDAMRGGYVEEMQEYMMVPLSQFGIRVFYNKDLLQKLTGADKPPRELRAFFALCDRIAAQHNDKGQAYIPIAGSGYHVGMWDSFMCDPFTYGAVRAVDFNRDGAVGNDELFVGFKTGRISMDFPPFAAKFKMLRELTRYFQEGYTGLGRDEAVFLFAQQRAVFITTGTWDAGSLAEQARGTFEVGVMDFPQPTRDDPEFGPLVQGPVYERPAGAFAFAVSRTSAHPEVAVDFLRFISSQRGNEELNRVIGWIPAIRDTKLDPLLAAFEPHLEGVYGAMPLNLGGETTIKWQQLYALYQVNQISFPDLAKEFTPFYLTKGPEEFAELQRNRRRGVGGDELFLAGMRARAMAAPAAEAASIWVKYRQLTAGRLIWRDLNAGWLEQLLAAGPAPDARPPYEFSPAVREKVRARLGGERH